MKKKILCFDLDNVICFTKGKAYLKAKPNLKAIKKINELYKKGHYIKIFTARYMGRNKDNAIKAKRQGYNITSSQLKKWKVNYNKLILGKPSYDLFVDDKTMFFKKNWYETIDKYL